MDLSIIQPPIRPLPQVGQVDIGGGIIHDPAQSYLGRIGLFKVEQVEQVANSRHVARDVVLVTALNWIGQVIPAAVAECGTEHPVPLYELYERRMFAINVANMSAG